MPHLLLDVCISNFCDCDISTEFLTVDHFPVFFFIDTHSVIDDLSPQPRFFRKVNNRTIKHFRELVESLDWEIVHRDSDVNIACNVFLQSIGECYDAAFPLQSAGKRTKKVRKPWVDP